MKILHVNTVCKTGSTGKIVYNLHSMLKEVGHTSMVCYGRGEIYPNEPDLVRLSSKIEVYTHALLTRLTGYEGIYSNASTVKLLEILECFKPDVVHLHNIHGYYLNEYKLLNYLKNNNIKTIYSMYDEYAYLGKCCNAFNCDRFKYECGSCPQVKNYPASLWFDRAVEVFNLKRNAYSGFEKITFVAPKWVVERAQSSALLKGRHLVEIDEAVDLEKTFFPRETSGLRQNLGIPEDHKIILSAAPFSNIGKGGKYFVELARMLVNEKIIFINVGYDDNKSNLPRNFIPIKYLKNQDELANYYSIADLYVCTSLIDTMPNVCLESLACGTPVCGFDAAGVPYVATPEFGIFTPTGDVHALADLVKNTPIKTAEHSRACRKYAEGRYSFNIFFEKYFKLYTEEW